MRYSMARTVLVTGCAGLIGSTCCEHFAAKGWRVYGIDCNMRKQFFGDDGDTSSTLARLRDTGMVYRGVDIRNVAKVNLAFKEWKPDLVLHCAAQPSHDFATKEPRLDFEVNALGTLNMLEAAREFTPGVTFIFASTNKVYGDSPNELPRIELPTRFDFPAVWCDEGSGNWDKEMDGQAGIGEWMSIDQSRHSLFGASKLAADVMVQEYGRTYGMKTACFRCGCLTGVAHAGAEQHGFLAYMAKCIKERRPYMIYGYKGKQVRDQLHAADVAAAFEAFAENPRVGEVYNLGGGRENSVSVMEAKDALENAIGNRLDWGYNEQARGGDHICWISDTTKFRSHYPEWKVTRSLDDIISELAGGRTSPPSAETPAPPSPSVEETERGVSA